MAQKPRKNKLDAKQFSVTVDANKKKEKDWTFEDIVRSKSRRR